MAKKKKISEIEVTAPEDVTEKDGLEQLALFPSMDDLSVRTEIENEDGSTDFVFTDGTAETLENEIALVQGNHFQNLVPFLSEEQLSEIAIEVIEKFESDAASQEEYLSEIVKSAKLLGLTIETKNEPFEGACSATHPLLAEALIKGQARESTELLGKSEIVKTEIVGQRTPELEVKATRVKNYINYQLNHLMKDFRVEHETQSFFKLLCGCGIKKLYFDPLLGRPRSINIPVDQFVISNQEKSIDSALTFTQIIPMSKIDMERNLKSGAFAESTVTLEDLGEPSPLDVGEVREEFYRITKQGVDPASECYEILEQSTYRNLDLVDGEREQLPYIITIDKSSRKILSIRRDWKKTDRLRRRISHFAHYSMIPGIGFYGIGFAQLLGNPAYSMTVIQRALIDAGQFANMKGGYRLKGLQITDNGPVAPGEFKEVTAPGMDLDKALKVWNWGEPSVVLFELFKELDARNQRLSDTTEQIIANSTTYGPVGTTLALLEAGSRFTTTIMTRTHHAFSEELKILKRLNKETINEQLEYNPVGAQLEITEEDFDEAVDIVGVSDANFASAAHRLAKTQAILSIAQQDPAAFNRKRLYVDFLSQLGEARPEDFLSPDPAEAQPLSPMEDLLALSQGLPIKAFPGQDHQAHISFKQAWLQDPLNGANNPIMSMGKPLVEANIREHMLLDTQEKLAAVLQVPDMKQLSNIPTPVMAVAMQAVTEMNRKISEIEQNQGGTNPEMIYAQAEMVKAQAQKTLADFRKKEKLSNYIVDAAKIQQEAKEHEDKMALEKLKVTGEQVSKKAKTLSDFLMNMFKAGV